jgi:hypothetical protein
MKQISEAQIKSIMSDLLILNIPVKSYVGMQELFESLPLVEDKGKTLPVAEIKEEQINENISNKSK